MLKHNLLRWLAPTACLSAFRDEHKVVHNPSETKNLLRPRRRGRLATGVIRGPRLLQLARDGEVVFSRAVSGFDHAFVCQTLEPAGG
jgi:hypothetical protein